MTSRLTFRDRRWKVNQIENEGYETVGTWQWSAGKKLTRIVTDRIRPLRFSPMLGKKCEKFSEEPPEQVKLIIPPPFKLQPALHSSAPKAWTMASSKYIA